MTSKPKLSLKTAQIVTTSAFLTLVSSCSQAPPIPAAATPPSFATYSELNPKTDWKVSAPDLNPMDNVSTQFVSTGYIVKLVLCFRNGRPCRDGSAPVFVTSPCWIDGDEPGSYHRKVRVKFDDEEPIAEHWGITDDHKGLTPPHTEVFVSELKKHKRLMVEFGCARSDVGEVTTLPIQGLQEALNSANLNVTSERVAESNRSAPPKALAPSKSQGSPSSGNVAAGSQLPCPCSATLRNGYIIPHDHRLVMGTTTRLYFSSDDSSFSDIPTADIIGYKTEEHR